MEGGLRAYARHRGCAPSTVHQAIKEGRIVREPNGKIIFERADGMWAENTIVRMDDARRRAGKRSSPTSNHQKCSPAGPGYKQWRAIRELYAAKLAKFDYEERRARLVDSEEVRIQWELIAAVIRNALLDLPARIAREIALGGSQHEVYEVLDRVCSETLTDLSNKIGKAIE
jgi:hypothetical protein